MNRERPEAVDSPAARRPIMAGVEVRQEDIEPQKGLHIAAAVLRGSAVVVFLLAMWQFGYWWLNRPPGGAGLGVLVGDTIRLTVFAALMLAASDVAALIVKTHYDLRATRILVARQTYMMRQMGTATGELRQPQGDSRRALDA
jgi:hypothetical protein